jgi:hypothetical protein
MHPRIACVRAMFDAFGENTGNVMCFNFAIVEPL